MVSESWQSVPAVVVPSAILDIVCHRNIGVSGGCSSAYLAGTKVFSLTSRYCLIIGVKTYRPAGQLRTTP